MWSGSPPPVCLSGCSAEAEHTTFEPVPDEGDTYERAYEVSPTDIARDQSREREHNLIIQWLQVELEYRFSALDAKLDKLAKLPTNEHVDHALDAKLDKLSERFVAAPRASTDTTLRSSGSAVRWLDEAVTVPAQARVVRMGSEGGETAAMIEVLPVTEENLRLFQLQYFPSRDSSVFDVDINDKEVKALVDLNSDVDDGDATSSNQADGGDDEVDLHVNSWRTGKTSGRNRRRIGSTAVQTWNFLEDPDSSIYALCYARFHTCFVMAGVCLLLLQTLHDSPVSGGGAALLDLGFDLFLLCELVVRFCVCPMKHMRFFRDGFNVLDLISTILPLSLRAENGWIITDAQESLASGNAPVMIMFCVVPVLRLLKLLRRFQKYQLLTHAFWLILEVLPVLLFTFLVIAMIFSSAIYIVEPRSNIKTMWHAVWFTVVTMTTVGYGDSTPKTTLGCIIAGLLMILSALYMAMPIGIVGQAFNQVWCDRDRILLMKRTRYKIQEWGYNATDIPALFRQFDVDCSGELDIEEFRQMITEMSIGLSDQRIVELFESIDADGGGSIDDKEFIRCLFPGLYQELCAQDQFQEDEDIDAKPSKQRFSVGMVLERGWSSSVAVAGLRPSALFGGTRSKD